MAFTPWDNPMGTDGFEFIEFAAPDPVALGKLFETMGFSAVAKHRHKSVTLYRQGGVNFIINAESDSFAQRFARRDLADRFAGLAWRDDHHLPRFDGVAAWLRCEQLTFEPGGDHTIVLGTVAEAVSADARSLAYHMRQFRSL